MKIINKENETHKLYVQLKDIDFLIHSGLFIPKKILQAISEQMRPVDEANKNDYCVFSKQTEIEYFNSVDFIIDYKALRKLEAGELSMMVNDIEAKILGFEEMYDGFTPEEQDFNNSILLQIERLAHKKRSIKELIDYKLGEISLNFPLIPDSEGFALDRDAIYQIAQSVNPNVLLLSRKDGKQLSLNERIPDGMIHVGLSMSMSERIEEMDSYDCEISKRLSPDSKYLIIEYTYRRPELRVGTSEDKNPKSLLRRIFNK